MVAVIDTGNISADLTSRRRVLGRSPSYSVAWRKQEWTSEESHLAMLVNDKNEIQWLGRAKARKAVSDRERRVNITEIEEIEATSVDALRGRIPDTYQPQVALGVLSYATGQEVQKALLTMHPRYADLVNKLSRPGRFTLPKGPRGLALSEQRDGTGLLLDIAGIGRDPLDEWVPADDHSSFLAGLGPRQASESALLGHDATRFPDLLLAQGRHVDWRVFGGAERRLLVLNANAEPLETTLGADILYYNATFGSFVLVQYKRMKPVPDPVTGTPRLWYRPDEQFFKELDRLIAVDDNFGLRPGEFRLYSKACWFKFCDPSAHVDGATELVKGMYLALDHVIELLGTKPGPRHGRRIGYDNVDRHINNTLFAQLVKDGWIGTRGTATAELEEVVKEVLASRRSLVLGVQLPGSPS